LAHHLELSRTTIWSLCRRYEENGLEVLGDAPRPGRPREISPPWSGWRLRQLA
ncbi:MAG: helix-turn-helix domain-containing protein, partial [Myxococcaceae bacterium]|nr:helix-turn-helix domain-containing protein [Myxococcaceae bacterium]